MPKFKRKSEIIEVMTFDELVEHGRANGANIVNGMPWCFKFHGYGVTHENDECYLIASRTEVIEMTPDHLLIILENGNIGVRDAKSFYDKHELVEQDKGNISDGYHTFNELYVHRHALFINVVNANQDKSFKTLRNDSGEQLDGWFIAGINTVHGQITYHLPIAYWDQVKAIEVDCNSDYDGHSSADVVERLLALAAE